MPLTPAEPQTVPTHHGSPKARIYAMLDTDGDGVASRQEYAAWVDAEKFDTVCQYALGALFDLADTGRSGTLDPPPSSSPTAPPPTHRMAYPSHSGPPARSSASATTAAKAVASPAIACGAASDKARCTPGGGFGPEPEGLPLIF